MIDHRDVVYIENETELLWLIIMGTICDENPLGQ